ncbi:Maf family protein [Neisseriaceae bacterium ESL0693]|nr:Maf family protein [Neisseriaceae bacterium ESL0693]
MPRHTVYLASGSPRRHDILCQLGYQVIRLEAAIDETAHPGEPAADYVERMAVEKNTAALNQNPEPQYPIISADTIVVLDQHILGKPHNAQQASAMLHSLSGRTHQVLTSVCVYWQNQQHKILQINEVTFAPLSAEQINAYVESKEPLDKAGAYGIQGLAGTFVTHISGSFTGIMGLPVYETSQLLTLCDCPPL